MLTKTRIGSAPCNWGVWFPDDPKQIAWDRFMDEIVEAGFRWIELGPYGYLPADTVQLKQELTKRKLQVSGTFAMGDLSDPAEWPEIKRQVLGAGEILAELGADYLILIDGTYTDLFTGKVIGPDTVGDEGWSRMIDATHKVADIANQQFSLTTVFHPHAETHVQYEDQIERFLDDTDPTRVSLCLDTGHHEYCGGDAVRFLSKHHDRLKYLHLKSINPDLRNRVNRENIVFSKAVSMGMFCELSKGSVDFPALAALLQKADFSGYAIVEQDMYPCPFDKPLPAAKRNREYLKQIGIG